LLAARGGRAGAAVLQVGGERGAGQAAPGRRGLELRVPGGGEQGGRGAALRCPRGGLPDAPVLGREGREARRPRGVPAAEGFTSRPLTRRPRRSPAWGSSSSEAGCGSRGVRMLIAMAGLPGTGKSALATRLAAALDGVVLSKDVVRAALFPPPTLDYSAAQDDLAMSAVYAAAKLILIADATRVVLLDGRTFRLAAQVADVFALGRGIGQEPVVIECVCDGAVACARLDRAAAAGGHPAGNRTAALYDAVAATAEPLTVPRLTLDTSRLNPGECLARTLDHLR